MTTNLQSTSLSSYLYDQDYCLWLETTAKLLRNHQLEHLDFENLISEIEDIGDVINSDFIVMLVSQDED